MHGRSRFIHYLGAILAAITAAVAPTGLAIATGPHHWDPHGTGIELTERGHGYVFVTILVRSRGQFGAPHELTRWNKHESNQFGRALTMRAKRRRVAATALREAKVAGFVTERGGRVLHRSAAGGTLSARLPRAVVGRLVRRPEVQAVSPMRPASRLDLRQTTSTIGAPTWWDNGYLGGRGGQDAQVAFAVIQDPVAKTHPAFKALRFGVPPSATPSDDPSITRHGTAIVSAAAAEGPTGCKLCTSSDASQRGVAPGLTYVLDPSGSTAELDWAAGIPGYVRRRDGEWDLQAGSPIPAQVVNYSRGADTTEDDSLESEVWDATVDSYGVTATVAAGNSGPSPRTVNDPALAFNVIAVGAFSGGGTIDPNDDSVFAWSSRGPTVGGRKKPDLVAVGDGGFAYSYYKETGKLWKYDTGTSYAAPQVGGGAILLAGAGIRDPKVVKAILINSARAGRADPSAPMGSQTTWQPDWGWGELNLDQAFKERLNFARGEVPANGARFFKATNRAPGDRATLVWHRRVADCQPLRQGCYYDSGSGFRVYTLSNLDLAAYDAATQAPLATSASTVDNVEQVRTPQPGTVVYKVSAGGVDGPAEPFAITGTRALTPLVTPHPTTELNTSTVDPQPGDQVEVRATLSNPSPDLTAEHATVTLDLPPSVDLVSGDRTRSIDTLSEKGAAGDRTTVTWTVRGTASGIERLTATATADRYGSVFRSTAATTLMIGSRADPGPTERPPAPGPDDASDAHQTNRPPVPQTHAAPLSPQLTITRIRTRGTHVVVAGTVALGANGRVRAVLEQRRHNRWRGIAHASTFAQLRRYRVRLRRPNSKTLRVRVTYEQRGGFAAQTRVARVR